MRVVEINNIRDYIKDSIFIGKGTTAYCYLRPNNDVVKIYRNNSYTKELFSRVDMLQRLTDIDGIQNDTYVGPETILIKDGIVVGYVFPYVDAKTLHTVSLRTTLFDLFNNIDTLIDDTKDISDKGFRLYDVHNKNILFDGNYYVIDLDKGKLVEDSSNIFKYNMSSIRSTILGQIFNSKPWEIIKFKDEELQEFDGRNSWTSDENIYEYFRMLANKSGEANPSIKQLRRKIDYKKYFNEYYKY